MRVVNKVRGEKVGEEENYIFKKSNTICVDRGCWLFPVLKRGGGGNKSPGVLYIFLYPSALRNGFNWSGKGGQVEGDRKRRRFVLEGGEKGQVQWRPTSSG